MAESTSTGTRSRSRTTTNAAEPRDTKRVVLRRERVIVVPDHIDIEQTVQHLKAADSKTWGKGTEAIDAWVVVGEFDGVSKTKAIEAYAGKPGTPDAKPGAYKAPTASAFSGGSIYEAPPAPLVQRRELS